MAASIAVGLAFLRCDAAIPPVPTRSRKIRVAHHRIKIERVYRNYLTRVVNSRLRLPEVKSSPHDRAGGIVFLHYDW
jgi:hypothetical protein